MRKRVTPTMASLSYEKQRKLTPVSVRLRPLRAEVDGKGLGIKKVTIDKSQWSPLPTRGQCALDRPFMSCYLDYIRY